MNSSNKSKVVLENTENISQAIVHSISDLLWLKDPNGVYLACNKRFEDFFGACEKDILGKTDYDFVDKELADFFRENDTKAILSATGLVNKEWIPFANDGHREFLETTKTPMYDKNNELIGVLGVGHNITERDRFDSYIKENSQILEMIATGKSASKVYNAIALMYEKRNIGTRCSLLELEDGLLLHGGAPSMPQEYCDAVHGLKNGPSVGSCGTSTFTGHAVYVENIATDPKWANIKDAALPHGLRSCWSQPIKDSSGKVLGAFGMYKNYPGLPTEDEIQELKSGARLTGIVMERDQAQKRIKTLAYQDELTSLNNRAYFYQKIEEVKVNAERYNKEFRLLYIDLDDFKSVNDSLGHDAGDILLKEITSRIKNVSRDTDFVSRIGGDEFSILIPEIFEDYDAAQLALRCLEAIAQPIELYGRKYTTSCSIGIACYPADGEDIPSLTKAADTALYHAKALGKNRYTYYVDELTRKAQYQFDIEQRLRKAIEDEKLTVVYQPLVNLNTENLIGVEALSRWNDPVLGEMSPEEFIPITEKIGMIKQHTNWVLRKACNQLVEWKKLGILGLRMSVNISPIQFLDYELINLLKEIINETGISPAELELEVTESVIQTNKENLLIFKELKEIGVLIAIDDFGTGYSSFSSLKHLTIDCLKIDKEFLDDVVTNTKSQLLLQSMIDMGHHMGCGIIAEGIEHKEQLEILKKFGCETGQGYLFAKGMSAEEITKNIGLLYN